MKKMANNEKGFSLIELMIVVAIIGILSAIAVPNFQRFQAKARQSEAKSNLSAYYQTAKTAFSEFGIYPGNFVAQGFNPDGDLNYRLTAANNANIQALIAGTPSLLGTPDSAACFSSTVACAWAGGVPNNWTEIASVGNRGPQNAVGGAAVAVVDATFNVKASGRIGTAVIDTWQINQRRTLQNVTVGLP